MRTASTPGGPPPRTRSTRRLVLALLIVVSLPACASAHASAAIGAVTDAVDTAPAHPRVIGYFTQWSAHRGVRLRDLDANGSIARLTHLHYAFGNVRGNRCEVGVQLAYDEATGAGGDADADYVQPYAAADSIDGRADAPGQSLRGHWNQLRKLKAKYPQLKVLISLGGWTLSRGFASAAQPENRQAFVASCIDAYLHGNLPRIDGAGGPAAAAGVFDGIDIDWEFPGTCALTCGSAQDRANFTALLGEFRRQLDAVRPGLLLSAAVGAGGRQIAATDPARYQRFLDYVNVMAYDYHAPAQPRTHFHAALYPAPGDPARGEAARFNVHDSVQALLARGVPRHKLVLGIASHGRGWSGVADRDHGLFQAGHAAAGSLGPGTESFRVLQALAWPHYRNRSAGAHWIYRDGIFWSFDDPASVAAKMGYVRAQQLGGGFMWELGGDDADGALLRAISDGVR